MKIKRNQFRVFVKLTRENIVGLEKSRGPKNVTGEDVKRGRV